MERALPELFQLFLLQQGRNHCCKKLMVERNEGAGTPQSQPKRRKSKSKSKRGSVKKREDDRCNKRVGSQKAGTDQVAADLSRVDK